MSATPKPPNDLRRILVIPLRFIGDTVLTVPLLENLHRAYPEANIDVWASATAAPLLDPCPYLHQVIREPRQSVLQTLQQLQGYDAAFILRKSFTMAAWCRLAGIPLVVGYDKQRFPQPVGYRRWGLGLHQKARYPSLKTDVPQVESHLNLLRVCGIPVQEPAALQLWNTTEDEASLSALLHRLGIDPKVPLTALHCASASHGKAFAPEKFVEALQRCHQAGRPILCTGTAQDAPFYEAMAQLSGVPLHVVAGKTSLRETVALYRRARLLITVDSSPIHLAAAAGTPHIVGVFGPTNHRQWGPYNPHSAFYPVFQDLPCRPCYAKTCEHNRCREDVTAADIAQAVTTALSRGA